MIPAADELCAQADAFDAALDAALDRAETAESRNNRLREAIETVLADNESQPGGWGPDVTMQAVLRNALAANLNDPPGETR